MRKPAALSRRSLWVLLTLGLGLPAIAGQTYAPVDVHGSGATALSVRISWQIFKPEPLPPAEGLLPKDSFLGGGLELKYSRFRGEQGQSLAAGEVISLGGPSMTGPQDLVHSFDLDFVELVLTPTLPLSDSPSRFELDFSLGLGYLDARLQTEASGGGTLRMDDQTLGFSFGFGARQWVRGVAAIEGFLMAFTPNPFTAFFGGAYGDGLNDEAWSGEMALIVAPLRHFRLRAGYGAMEFMAAHDYDAASEVRLKSSGPFLGLQVAF